MISGVGLEAALVGAKSAFTDQEGLARIASKSSEGLVVEESVRVLDALTLWIGGMLLARRVLRQCLDCIV